MTTGATTPGNSYSIVNNSFHKKKKSIFETIMGDNANSMDSVEEIMNLINEMRR